jgi:hydrogenase maturation protease
VEVRSKTLLVGLGNDFMGDDGVGVAVAKILEKRGLPPNVDLLEGSVDGFTLLELMPRYERVIVVDAADMGLEPGEWRAFEAKPELLGKNLRTLTHLFSLGEALELAERLGLNLPPIKIYAIQPKFIGFTGKLRLTSSVARAAQAVVASLQKELN